MQDTSIVHSISISLLRFVRNGRPTERELLEWLDVSQQGRYYILRKAGLLLLQEDKVMLSPQHLSPDGKRFVWKHLRYNIDEETIDIFRAEEPEAINVEQNVAATIAESKPKPEPRPQFGSGKGLILYMASDFDAPLDDFKEYME